MQIDYVTALSSITLKQGSIDFEQAEPVNL